ncbi:hypothetical protein R6L23_15440 [Streptomyces sp. SR27]|nr:hypothetical protein [Streptomyces sp. SR27]MDV9189590.1 hypothetical protein [Streptomyces sp. SR27]
MRLRSAMAASAGALVLLLAAPGSASAANAQFRYTCMTADGYDVAFAG